MEPKGIIAYVVYPMINVIYIYSFSSFFSKYYPHKRPKWYRYYPLALFASYVIIEIPALYLVKSLWLFIANFVGVFILTLFYRASWGSRFCATSILCAFSFAMEGLCLGVYCAVTSLPFEVDSVHPQTAMLLCAISKLSFLALTQEIAAFFHISKKEERVLLPVKLWGFIPIIYGASISVIYILFESIIVPEQSTMILVGIALVLLTDFCVFNLYDRLLKEAATRQENSLLTQQNKMLEQHFLENVKAGEEIQSARHDIKNIMLAVLSEVEDSNIAQKETILKKFENILGSMRWEQGISQCGLPAIDVVINCKSHFAKQHQIKLDAQVVLPANYEVNSRAVAIILGNALDNAIEACLHVEVKRRIIKIFITQHLCNLFISLSNPYCGEVVFGEDALPKTTKVKKGHGIGSKSIRAIVQEVGGHIQYETKGQIFKVEILLFNQPTNE